MDWCNISTQILAHYYYQWLVNLVNLMLHCLMIRSGAATTGKLDCCMFGLISPTCWKLVLLTHCHIPETLDTLGLPGLHSSVLELDWRKSGFVWGFQFEGQISMSVDVLPLSQVVISSDVASSLIWTRASVKYRPLMDSGCYQVTKADDAESWSDLEVKCSIPGDLIPGVRSSGFQGLHVRMSGNSAFWVCVRK